MTNLYPLLFENNLYTIVWGARSWRAGRDCLRPGNFTRLYWAIRGHKFAYPGRKDTIKACIYVKELVRFIWWRATTSINEL